VLARDTNLLVATDRGLAELSSAGDLAARPVPIAAAPDEPRERTPDVAAVQAAVLAYLDLAPGSLRRLERRARNRGWLPRVRAIAGFDRDRNSDWDRDEVLASGSVWSLYDLNDTDGRGTHADLELLWELGTLAAPDDAINISRERRLVVELRDQVLERVHRLYFERLRVREALAAERDPGKQRELALRVAELTAALDGWTGGAFTRLLADSSRTDRRQP
jgi:hypothetical protein